MGAKWGFYKFPLDPERIAPAPDELSWRPPPARTDIDALTRMEIAFDLALPLPPQLEAAKFRLVSRAAELRRQGHAAPQTVANQLERWTTMLRLLDAESAGQPVEGADVTLLREAQAMAHSGYLGILRLAAPGADTK